MEIVTINDVDEEEATEDEATIEQQKQLLDEDYDDDDNIEPEDSSDLQSNVRGLRNINEVSRLKEALMEEKKRRVELEGLISRMKGSENKQA